MPVEDRVKNLEGNVATLTERVDGHIKQSASDKVEAKQENLSRHSEVMTGLDTLGTGIAANAQKLSNIEAVKEAFEKHGITTDEFQRPVGMNPKQKVAIGVGGSVGGLALLYEILRHVLLESP